jgi:hypothetical protein
MPIRVSATPRSFVLAVFQNAVGSFQFPGPSASYSVLARDRRDGPHPLDPRSPCAGAARPHFGQNRAGLHKTPNELDGPEHDEEHDHDKEEQEQIAGEGELASSDHEPPASSRLLVVEAVMRHQVLR